MAQIKTNFVETLTETKVLPTTYISDEGKLRVVIEQASGGNVVVIRGRITGQDDWDILDTLNGSVKKVVSVATYDELQIECTVYAPVTNLVKVIVSSFNEAGGSTSIDAPSGGTISSDSIAFTSSDGSVIIIADENTNSIDFQAAGGGGSSAKYVKTVILSDWVGPSAGEYSLTIPFSFHAKANPVVTCLETNGSDFDLIDAAILLTNNDVKIVVLSTPDTRFVGKIFID